MYVVIEMCSVWDIDSCLFTGKWGLLLLLLLLLLPVFFSFFSSSVILALFQPDDLFVCDNLVYSGSNWSGI